MHRDPSFSLAETIVRLEAEVCELRALGGKRRERRLVVTAVASMLIAMHAVLGCIAIKAHADRVVREASKRLEGRTSDFVSCVHRLDALTGAVDAVDMRDMRRSGKCSRSGLGDEGEETKSEVAEKAGR